LKGRVALVTGGSTGLGFGVAKHLLEAGAIVYITGRRQAQLDEAVARLGGSITAVRADVTSKSDMQSVADAIDLWVSLEQHAQILSGLFVGLRPFNSFDRCAL
jgi:NAD(P)-dependent dehydrogenase (short-subunit alcohol dehydrogenase family)